MKAAELTIDDMPGWLRSEGEKLLTQSWARDIESRVPRDYFSSKLACVIGRMQKR